MFYIYCYTNLINNHKYVGQTNNLQRRIREHRSCAYNPKACSYNDLIHQKIRQYGENNFEIEVLEKLYTDDQDLANERETYWIDRLQSFCGTGLGYNKTLGGQDTFFKRKFSKKQIVQIKQMLKSQVPFVDIQKELKASPSFISMINHGIYAYDELEDYPLCKFYKNDEDYDELINLLVHSSLPLAEIARQLNMGYSTVKKINAGTLRKGIYPTYPIRKISRSDRIKDYLLNSTKTIHEIAQLTNCSNETVKRINVGTTFYDNKLTYPLRNL